MSKSIYGFILLGLGLALIPLAAGITVSAQEIPAQITDAVNLDEDIGAEDLGIKEPRVLPDSRLYFLKDWGRSIRSFFTFNPVKKAELKLIFANEKLIEVKKLVELKKNSEVIKKGLENYQKEIEKIESASEKIKEKAQEDPAVSNFLGKFTKHQILHQRILQKLENQVPSQALEKIKAVREEHLRKFGEVMTRLEDKDKISERLEKDLEEIEGSKYKNFKNLEILLELEEKVPEEAKEAIRKAQENALKRLKGDLEKMSPEDQERFKEYLERISGGKEKQLEILENLKSELREKPEIEQKLEEAREGVLRKLNLEVKKIGCLEIKLPEPDFCQEGRVILQKDEKGCIVSFRCLIPQELEIKLPPLKETGEAETVCITLWAPVCGKDGKTYSNTCFAKVAGVEIDYKGVCEEIENTENKRLPERIVP